MQLLPLLPCRLLCRHCRCCCVHVNIILGTHAEVQALQAVCASDHGLVLAAFTINTVSQAQEAGTAAASLSISAVLQVGSSRHTRTNSIPLKSAVRFGMARQLQSVCNETHFNCK